MSSPDVDTNRDNHRAAILLLDFQNEFVKKGGKLHHEVAETMVKTGILENAPKLVEAARKTNSLIIYSTVVMKETDRFNDIEKQEVGNLRESYVMKTNEYQNQHGLFTENTWNCEIIHEVEPRNNDVILRDRCDFSAFAGTKLLACLKENNVKHFFVMGILTNICVYQTSTTAARLLPDISTYVVHDCCVAKTENDHNTALEEITSSSTVKVISSNEAESLLEENKSKTIGGDDDEWLMVEKLFSAAGVAGNKNISVGKLQSLIECIPSSSTILSILSENGLEEKKEDDKTISREDLHRILFQRKPRTDFLEKLAIFILVAYIPFFYSLSTRIPFIFVALEITVGRGRALWEVGVILGVYQTSRALGNLFIVMFGGKNPFKRLQIFMILSGLFGWTFLALWDRPAEASSVFSFKPSFSNGEGDIRPLFALFCVGFCETIVILQRALMTETAKESPSGAIDKKVLARRFTAQYSLVSFGATAAFLIGGWLYTSYGFYSVVDFGIIVQIAHLFGALIYLALAKNSKKSLKGDELDGNDAVRSLIYQFQALTVISKYSRDVANGTDNVLGSDALGLSIAAIKAKSDRVLNHSLSEMYKSFFSHERNDIDSMEELLKSIDKARTEESLISRRPLAMAIGKNKLSKLLLFLMKSKGGGSLSEREFCSFWAPRIYISIFESSQEVSVSVAWPYMKALVASQAIAALCIGVFLSTALLSYTQRFDMDAAQVGVYLGIGEGLGVIIILGRAFLPTCSRIKSNTPSLSARVFSAFLSRPLNVPMVLLVASSASMLFSIDHFVVALICQMCYSAVNDLSVSYMNELTGTSLPPEKFKFYQGIGQWLRRIGNMVTAILGPIFFGIHRSFPFLFFGAIVFVWAFILWFLMYQHASRMQQSFVSNNCTFDKGEREKDENSCLSKSLLVEPFLPFLETSRTPWSVLEQRYYALNKEQLEEELNTWKKASVDITLMEHQIRCLSAALEVEKDQRRTLEDRLYARVAASEKEEE